MYSICEHVRLMPARFATSKWQSHGQLHWVRWGSQKGLLYSAHAVLDGAEGLRRDGKTRPLISLSWASRVRTHTHTLALKWSADLAAAMPSEASELFSLYSGQTHSLSFRCICFEAPQTLNSLRTLALTAYPVGNILLLTLSQLRSLPPSSLRASYLSSLSLHLLI